jgi:hypothetical protein
MYSGVAVRVKGPVVKSVQLGDQLFFGGFLASEFLFFLDLLFIPQLQKEKETERFQTLGGMQGIIAEYVGDFPQLSAKLVEVG